MTKNENEIDKEERVKRFFGLNFGSEHSLGVESDAGTSSDPPTHRHVILCEGKRAKEEKKIGRNVDRLDDNQVVGPVTFARRVPNGISSR